MKVCIAEKPSVAKEIAKILGANRKLNGYFEGNGYQVTWTFGHFCELVEPDYYSPAWKRWNMDDLPMVPTKYETALKDDAGVKKQFKVIQRLLKNCSGVINCGDAGQEGELIQRWVLKQAQYTADHQRLWISSLTSQAIKAGFKKLRASSEFDNLYYAGLVRAIGDWSLGMNASRAYTLKFGGYKNILTIGRVQTPTLGLVVERYLAIENFKPFPYWVVTSKYREIPFTHQKKQFKSEAEASSVFQEIQGQPFKVVEVISKTFKSSPLRLFDLTTLQVECNKKFSFPAEKTLKLAQKLYEKKMISYPRVDTQYLSDDVFKTIPGIIQTISKYQTYSTFTQQISTPLKKSKRYFNSGKVTDHHAIIPTHQTAKSLPVDEGKVYDLVIRRFLSIFLNDAVEEQTTVRGQVSQHLFQTTGKVLKEAGWKAVYPMGKKNDNAHLPPFTKGEGGPQVPAILEKETQPPKLYTEATLLRAMETCGKGVEDDSLREALKENGMGRPSTRAAILETLLKRGYIKRNRKNILPTEKGIQLIAVIQNETLKSPELTGVWEKRLREIEKGSYKAGVFLKELNVYVANIVEEVKKAKGGVVVKTTTQKPIKGLAACPKCKVGQVIENKKAFSCSQWKGGCDFTVWKKTAGKNLTENQVKILIQKGRTAKLKGFKSKQGKPFEASLTFDAAFKVRLEF